MQLFLFISNSPYGEGGGGTEINQAQRGTTRKKKSSSETLHYTIAHSSALELPTTTTVYVSKPNIKG